MSYSEEFLDQWKIFASGGNGGSGVVSFSRTKKQTPSGGNGGHGGNVILVSTDKISSLNIFKGSSHFFAPAGEKGGYNNCHGKSGADKKVYIPLGTRVYSDNGELLFIANKTGESFTVARGGKGGVGNGSLMSSVNQYIDFTLPPELGEKKWVSLDLYFPAEVSIIGDASTGKSLFLHYATGTRIPDGYHSFKHEVPIIGARNNMRFIEIPSFHDKNIHQLKHISDSRIILWFINDFSQEKFLKLLNSVKEYNRHGKIWFIMVNLLSFQRKRIQKVLKFHGFHRKILSLNTNIEASMDNLVNKVMKELINR